MKTKSDYRQACKIVQRIVDEIDPFSMLAHGAPEDEFEGIAAEIARHIPNMRSADDAADAFCEVLSKAFGENYRPAEFRDASRKLFKQLTEAGFIGSPSNSYKAPGCQ